MIKPLHSLVLIKPEEQPTGTATGFLLTEKDEIQQKGTIIAVGPGKLTTNGSRGPMSVSVGDTVYFKKFAPTEYKEQGELFYLVEEADILAIC